MIKILNGLDLERVNLRSYVFDGNLSGLRIPSLSLTTFPLLSCLMSSGRVLVFEANI
jgi:hypothetical protein